MEALQDEISLATKKSPWDGRDFVPKDEIKRLITKGRIESISAVRPHNAFDISLKVIAILLCIGELKALDTWLSEGFTDDCLPVEYDENEKVFVKKISEEEKKTFKPFSERPWICKKFVRQQWDFLAPVFSEGDLKLTKADKSCPLPIIWRDTKRDDESRDAKTDDKSPELHKSHDQGTFGVVDKIQIHHAHLEPHPVSSIRSPFSMLSLIMLKSPDQGK